MDPVVLITVDCLRADHIGCYGYDRPTSPNIDQFSETATIFEPSYSNCPGTRWAFQSLHTGVSTLQIDGLGIPESYTPLAAYFQEAGYTTAGFAVNGFVSRDYRYDNGFDSYYSIQEQTTQQGILKKAGVQIDNLLQNDYIRKNVLVPLHNRLLSSSADKHNQFRPTHSDEDTVDHALSFLADHKDQPYFLWVHLMDAHTPYGYWREHLEKIRGDANIEHTIHPGKEGKITVSKQPPKEVIDTYDACIRSVDEQIGRLLEAIDDDATVVITGDHGEEFGQYGKFHQASLYSTMTQVPILVRSPNIEQGRVEMPAQHLDLPPTLMYAAGIEAPDHFEGSPLQTLDRDMDEPIFFTLGPNRIAVRVGDWKYIKWEGNEELYHVQQMGSENETIEDSERLSMMRNLVTQYRKNENKIGAGKQGLEEGSSDLSTEVETNLEDLGYL